ncbi:MAG: phage tail protein [Trebonia sp.]
MRQIRKYRHFRTIAEIAGAAVLLGGGATAAAAVLPAAAATTIHGCENAKTGALSVQLKSSCPAGTKALSWNTTGPRGPAGTTGILGARTNAAHGDEGASNGSCYIGQILLSAGSVTPPGTLLASGQTLAINDYLALFSLLGTEYGGNGKTAFKLPDLRKSAPDGLTYSICVQGIFPPSS